MKDTIKDLAFIGGWSIAGLLILFLIGYNIFNYFSCLKYWNTPMVETPTRCINSSK